MQSVDDPMRCLNITLSAEQQIGIMRFLTQTDALQRGYGIEGRHADAVVLETMARITPAMSYTKIAVMERLREEAERYLADRQVYVQRHFASRVEVNVDAVPPPGIGEVPAILTPEGLSPWTVPNGEAWRDFARRIDGPAIATLLGLELTVHYDAMRRLLATRGRWIGSYLDLRLVLYCEATGQAMSVTSGHRLPITWTDADEERIAGLLAALRRATPGVPAFNESAGVS